MEWWSNLTENGIIAVYLAAGKSTRMGLDKLSLPLGAHSIGNSALQAALHSTLAHIIVVTRETDSLKWIHSALHQAPLNSKWTQIPCLNSEKGQSFSLQCGLRAALERKPMGIMVLLADQPFLTVKTLNDLIDNYLALSVEKAQVQFVAARFQGIPRPPIIFSPNAVPELMKLTGDEGARILLRKLTGFHIDYNDAGEFVDIDIQQDYQAWKGADATHD